MGANLKKWVENPTSEIQMKAVFQRYDKNHDGYIDSDEFDALAEDLENVFEKLYEEDSKGEWKSKGRQYINRKLGVCDFIKKFQNDRALDTDNDGKISWDEWKEAALHYADKYNIDH